MIQFLIDGLIVVTISGLMAGASYCVYMSIYTNSFRRSVEVGDMVRFYLNEDKEAGIVRERDGDILKVAFVTLDNIEDISINIKNIYPV